MDLRMGVPLLLLCLPAVLCYNSTALDRRPQTVLEDVVQTFFQMREEAVRVREEAQLIREEGYEALRKTYDVKESANEDRDEIQTLLIDTLTLLKNQILSSNLYIQEMKTTLTGISSRMESVEKSIGEIEQNQIEQSEKVDAGLAVTETVNSRLQAWISEVRLISLFKMADQNNPHPGYGTGVVTDGQFMMSSNVHSAMHTHSHTNSKIVNNKIWITLGGLFRIHRVYIWNYRNCCQEQLVGTHVYADKTLLGAVIHAENFHDFLVTEDTPTYAHNITLHQPLAQNLHPLEVQVWGSGPFNEDDLFA